MLFQRLSIAAVLALSLRLAPHAHAQGTGGISGGSSVGGIRVTLISVGKREVNSIGQIYLNGQECSDNATLLFKVDYAPSGKPTIDIYSGENCNNTDRTSTTTNRCKFLPPSNPTGGVTMGLMLHVKAQDLVADCAASQESKPKLWFLAVSSMMSAEDVGNRYALFDQLEVDTTPPSAPTSVSSSEGERVVPVKWTGGQTNLKGFTVYIDPNPGMTINGAAPPTAGGNSNAGTTGAADTDGGAAMATTDAGATMDGGATTTTTATTATDAGVVLGVPNPACPSLYLLAGAAAGTLPDGLRVKHIDEPTGTGVDLSPDDIGSAHAAVAVVSVDLAGNESVLSNVACLNVVPTTSFWDRYLQNGGQPKSGCACSSVGATQLESAWPVALAMLALWATAQRRRKS